MTLQVDIGARRGSFELDCSFAAEGGVTALFGRSGSGKTTLVDAIAGLVRPTRGRIVVDGEVLFDARRRIDVATHRRRIGYVFQDARLFPHLDVRANLLYGYHLNRAQTKPITLEQVTELMGVRQLLARRPGGLSGGERQRVAIGRALLANPRMLLMDEPLASLDDERKAEILRYIERLRDELAIPIIYVSHSIEEITRLASTVVLVADGRVAAAGPLAAIMNRSDLGALTGGFEAGSVIDTQVIARDAHYDLTTLAFDGGCFHATHVDARVGESVRVRVRARDVAIALDVPSDISMLNVLRGRVTSIAAIDGPSVLVSVAVGRVAIMARLTRLSAERLALAPGCEVVALVKSVSLDRQTTGYA